MNSKLVLSALLAWGLSVSAGASEDPANSTLLKQCESSQGEEKSECREVAKEILRNDAPAERDDKTSRDVTHSSPAMTGPAEAKREAANKKREPAEKKAADAPEPAHPDAAK